MGEERLLVVGGGGARGAWGGGFARYLTKKHNQPYRYVFGTSTGSLMAPLIVLNDFVTLKEAYTSVVQQDIFDVNPFKPDGTLKGLNAAIRFLLHKDSFGESHNLLELIKKFLTEGNYQKIIAAKGPGGQTQFTVTSINVTNGEVVYKSSGPEMSYDMMCRWIWASSNEPLFMTFVPEDGGYFADGGVRANVPVVKAMAYAMEKGIKYIDVIINKPIDPIVNKKFKPNGILKNLLRIIELWETEVRNSNVQIATLLARLGETDPPGSGAGGIAGDPGSLELHFHYIPQALFEDNQNELIFDKEKMKGMWAKGEEGQEDKTHHKVMKVYHHHVNTYIDSYPFPGKNYRS